MKATASKENATPSQSSQPFINKKGEGSFLSSTNEQEQPFFSPSPGIQRNPVSSSFSGGYNFANIPIFSPRSQPVIQTKLTINEPGDQYEQEADAMADRVMRMPAFTPPSDRPVSSPSGRVEVVQRSEKEEEQMQRKALPAGNGLGSEPVMIQRKCATCEEEKKVQRQEMEEEEPLQAKPLMRKSANGGGGYTASPQLASQLNSSKGGGDPLPKQTLGSMNQAFGADFSKVRIHTGAQAAEMSQGIQAKAFTHGSNIYFNHGHFAPQQEVGWRLLAHELTHVVQQRGGTGEHLQRAPGGTPTTPVEALEPLEVVAQRIARLAIGPSSAAVNLKGGPGKVVSVIRNERTGQIYVGLNTGLPASPTQHIQAAIQVQRQRIATGEVVVVHTAADAVGGHAEINALDQAIAAEEKVLRRALTEQEITATFEMHNVWLSGSRKLTTAPRCEHCKAIARGVKVTESLFKAEGGVSGEIEIPQRGSVTPSGGSARPVTSARGTIYVPQRGSVTPSGGSVRPVTSASGTIYIPAPTSQRNATHIKVSSSEMPTSFSRGGRIETAIGVGIDFLGALFEVFVLPKILDYFKPNNWDDETAKQASELIYSAIESQRGNYEALIKSRINEIEAAQLEGRLVILRVDVNTNWQDTTYGRVLTNAEVGKYQLIFEDPPPPQPYSRDTNSWADSIRSVSFGVTLGHETIDIELVGTDPRARHFRETRKKIALELAARRDIFESLILKSYYGGWTKEDLIDYTQHQHKDFLYWKRMRELVEARYEEVIIQAKVKGASLDELREFAIKNGWKETVKLIDEPLKGANLTRQLWNLESALEKTRPSLEAGHIPRHQSPGFDIPEYCPSPDYNGPLTPPKSRAKFLRLKLKCLSIELNAEDVYDEISKKRHERILDKMNKVNAELTIIEDKIGWHP